VRRARLALLVAGLALLVPERAGAATPGVNVSGVPSPALVDIAASAGAKQIRVFAHVPAHAAPFQAAVTGARARGMSVVFVLQGSASGPDTDPARFAAAAGAFSAAIAQAGGAAAYEVWNEPDEPQFWRGPPDPVRYTALLEATAPRLRAGDPGAKVLLGPLTGNNADWLRAVYEAGGRRSFDGVAVHTDTACLISPPSAFARERDGDVSRFSFLGFRTVRDVMVARGDGDKGIWMTELGWSTATSPCARGEWAGLKPAGVSEEAQAANLAEAYRCLANYPYVENGLWFTLDDTAGHGDELDNYGLRREDGMRKPAWDAFRAVASAPVAPGPCGDFGGPTIALRSPATTTRYVGALSLSAVATDPSGVARVTFRVDGRTIRNFTGADVASGRTVRLEWQGAKRLSLGSHTLSVLALDPSGNTSHRSIGIRRVRSLPATLPTQVRLGDVTLGPGRVATVAGRVLKSAAPGLSGRVRVVWQRRRGARWATAHKALLRADRPFRAAQALGSTGTWRVRATYVAVAPYRSSSAVSPALRAP
jgi:hypothetical protein